MMSAGCPACSHYMWHACALDCVLLVTSSSVFFSSACVCVLHAGRCTKQCGATVNAASTSGGATPGPSAPSTRWTTCQPAARASRAARSGGRLPGSAASQPANHSLHSATAVFVRSFNWFLHNQEEKQGLNVFLFFFCFLSNNSNLWFFASGIYPQLFLPVHANLALFSVCMRQIYV